LIFFKPFNIPNIKKIKEEFVVEKKLPELLKGKNSTIIIIRRQINKNFSFFS
jgi:hypothetical protein